MKGCCIKIAREGYAPSSLGCKPGALLLRQRAESGTALRSSAVRRTTASGLSPDRTELRTRVREMLCICGACDTENGGAPENRTLDGFQAAAVFGTVSSSMPDVLHEMAPRVGIAPTRLAAPD